MEAFLVSVGKWFLQFLHDNVPPALFLPAVIVFAAVMISGALIYRKKTKDKISEQETLVYGIARDIKTTKSILVKYVDGDENITEQQAQRVYELAIDLSYHEMYRIYKQCQAWYDTKKKLIPPKETIGPEYYEQKIDGLNDDLNERMKLEFDSMISDMGNRLKDFLYHGDIMSDLQTVTPSEWNHWRHNLYLCIVENTNSVRDYLKNKATRNKNEFNERLHKSSRNK